MSVKGFYQPDGSILRYDFHSLDNIPSNLVYNTSKNLLNYYLKSEVYTKEEVYNLISAIPKFSIRPVDTLPTEGIDLNTVYLLKSQDSSTLYSEYIYVDGNWEHLGTTTIDFSTFASKESVENNTQQIRELLDSSVTGLNIDESNNIYLFNHLGGVVGDKKRLPLTADGLKVEQDINGDYNIYLTKGGEIVGEGTTLPATGGGGNGGGNSSSSEVKLTNQNGTNLINIPIGNEVILLFNFSSLDDGIPTGEGTCEIIVNDVTQKTFSVKQGPNSFNLTNYVKAGTNNVKVKCTDVYGNYKILSYTISVIDLRLTSTFDDTLVYDDVLQFKYTPYGAVEKTVHILVDGKEVHTETTTLTGKQTTINIPKQTHGTHRIDAYITAVVEEKDIESKHLLFDVLCIEADKTEVLISSVYETTTISQGSQVSIPYIVVDPAHLNTEVSLIISVDGKEYSNQPLVVSRARQYWNTRNYPLGNVSFTIKCGDVEKTHTLKVTEIDLNVDSVTNDLELFLTSSGRSNSESNPNVWEYEDITTTFDKVNWESTGWVTDDKGDSVLRLNGGATAEIQFKPFENDFKSYGKTIELEFAIRDVNNRDAIVMSCMNGGIGFEVSADKAILKSEQSSIFCNYCDEERVRVSFVIESRSEYRLLLIYLNGVLSGAKQYPTSDNFQQLEPVNIRIGSPYCGVDVYAIRSYSNALTFTEIIGNYITDIPDIGEKIAVYEDNDIYDEYGNLKYDVIKKKIPVMTIIGSLPQSKGDKKNVTVKFEHNTNSDLNFTDSAVIDVQGTSSQWYIRKNYKEKTSNEHVHAVGQMPTNVFCTKADYAEATGTHNTQNANLVETLYTEKTPAQLVDERCRTTIFGYPIVIFHQTTENAEPEFIGKYNFNFDKGSERVFGFDGTFDVESWEFKNNTSKACLFQDNLTDNWGEDFEARYPEDNKNIRRFKQMHDWVVSTKGDVAKFKEGFEDFFDLHYSLIYYVYTSAMLMVDQRAKNMFLTYWAETDKWQPWFYDNDTCLGINNEGQLVFDYYHEDIDIVDGANVYNGQNSVLWTNFREAYADEIKECYQTLRNSGKLTYEKVVEHFITNGSKKWSASIYNEDSDYKYISMLRSENDATNLYQVRGNGEEHLKYFVLNRLNYLDSKWYASDYADNYVALRIYTPSEWAGVEPSANITVIPFSNMYAGVRYKANGTLYQKRVNHGESVTFSPQGEVFESENNETFNDTETAIYGASEISSLGDLAPLYCGSINVSKAKRLVILKAGDSTEGYSNPNLKEISVGTNRLLKVIDVRNCPNLVSPLALSGCPNIEEIYATGSGITGIELAKSGYLKVVHLPETLVNLTMSNQLYITDFRIDGLDSLVTLNIENCPAIDVFDIMESAPNLSRVRLAKVDWTFDDVSVLQSIASKGYKGVDENGDNVETAQISGNCHIKTLTGEEYEEVKTAFPYMEITYDNLTSQLIFMSADGVTELTRQTIINGGDGYDPVVNNELPIPTKEETERFKYVYANGWSTTLDGEINESALNNVITDRKVYPVFTFIAKTYLIFTDAYGQELTRQTIYGGADGYDPVLTGELTAPTKNETDRVKYDYIGWGSSLSGVVDNNVFNSVTEDRYVYPIFSETAKTYLIFMNEDGTQELNRQVILNGANGYDPVASGTISTPTKNSTAQYTYAYAGWSNAIGGAVNNSLVNSVTEDRTLYVVFTATLRTYTVRFFNGTELVQSNYDVPYGSSVSYKGEALTYTGTEAGEWVHQGWTIDTSFITSDTDTYAKFVDASSKTRKLIEKTLTSVDNSQITSVGEYAFYNCRNLTSVILRSETIVVLSSNDAFDSTPIKWGTGYGYIYVPRALIEEYKGATNWSTYANQFRAIEDYTVDGTLTGAMDTTKM